VVVSLALSLVPQPPRLTGIEVLVLAAPTLAVTLYIQRQHRRARPDDPLLWTVSRMSSTLVATAPATFAGISLAVHWGGGFCWLAVAAVLGIVGAAYGAWVLLVEIVR
jgi:hypothetical protein